jgi:hypothetical protein
MIHGPCGLDKTKSSCLKKDGKCNKFFPKPFNNQTFLNDSKYPIYRRRDMGTFVYRGRTLDNRWVVGYNKYLSKKYLCHINVEIISYIEAVKYLFKYLYKKEDSAKIQILRVEDVEPSQKDDFEVDG